jgi:septum formation protein
MFQTNAELILASQSPRRIDFFSELGLRFTSYPADINETRRENEPPIPFVRRIAYEKAEHVGKRYSSAWIVSADTIVTIDQDVLGKPQSAGEAAEMLMRLSGKKHEVQTGYCLFCENESIGIVNNVATTVQFAPFAEDVAQAYIKTNEPLDKAGAYGIQGLGGILVARINGSYSNVVGLPMAEIITLLQHYRVISPRP